LLLPKQLTTLPFQVGVLIEEPFPMLALDALCKQLHDGMKDVMAVQESVHARLVAKTKGSRRPQNGWTGTKREEAKID
jgi:ion channel-forming bestrophin family protein